MLGDHRADVRRAVGHAHFDAFDILPAEQVVHCVEVITDGPWMMDRANQSELIGYLGELGMQFAQLHARHSRGDRVVGTAVFGRRVRLQVPAVKMAHAAAEQNEDAGFL